jgi:deoxyribodipyrimidine photolyase-related protein
MHPRLSASRQGGGFQSLLRDDGRATPKRWVFLLYDQLNLNLLPFDDSPPEETGILLIESTAKGTSRPYHKQKIAMLISNMRHFAIEAQSEGYPVAYLMTKDYYSVALEKFASVGSIHVIKAAEKSTRDELSPLIDSGLLTVHPHRGWITPMKWFIEAVGAKPPYRMAPFYQKFRQETGILMDGSTPIGGKYSFDSENRSPWDGKHELPEPPVYPKDDIDLEVESLIDSKFSGHPGKADLSALPTTIDQVNAALGYAISVLPLFGRYEDAMTVHSKGLFHSRLASLLNLSRLLPRDVLDRVLSADAPLNSIEGFVRQIVWREYVHHVHVITNGFQDIEVNKTLNTRNDAGWWESDHNGNYRRSSPNHLNQDRSLPMAYWGEQSGLNCLDQTIQSVMEDGWTHHIPRLMVQSNIASLLDVNPRELTDWFHASFIDAFDWVVEPNVLGMGTYALGDAMMTKPYVSGTPYINRMGDYCKSCSLDPRKSCPISSLYWAYLERHRSHFEGNFRMSMPLRTLSKRSHDKKFEDQRVFESVYSSLRAGKVWRPEDLPPV